MATTVVLRDYQQASIAQVRALVRDGKRPILVLPTGGGKTKTAVLGIVKPTQAQGARVLWIAHRTELIGQADADIRREGIRTGIIMGGTKSDASALVQVASVATLARRTGSLPEARVVIIDECHHVRSATYMGVVAEYTKRGAIIIGLTATPERLDGKGLGDVFSAIVEEVTVRELIDAGSLSEYRYFAPYTPDLTGIKKVGGDYSTGATSERMNKSSVTGNLVTTYRKHLDGKRALVFACSIEHSKAIVEQFKAQGISAAHLDGTTPGGERASVLADFAAGRTLVVSNVDLFDEGFDCPAVAGVLIARPTQSFTKHRQMIGRSLRPFAGKEFAVILDHAGNFLRHGMPDDVTEWTLESKVEKEPAAKHKSCPECYAVLPVSASVCPCCGYVFSAAPRSGPEFKDGDLNEVQQKRWTQPEKELLFRTLLAQASCGGYMVGWAKRQYRLKTRVWPKGLKAIEEQAMRDCHHARVDDATQRCRFCGAFTGTNVGAYATA